MAEIEYEPVPVIITNTEAIKGPLPLKKIITTVGVTAILPALTGGVSYIDLLPYDTSRLFALVYADTNPVVICDSLGQAQDPANSVANIPNPNGFFLAANKDPIQIPGSSRLWVAGPTPGTRISVLVVHQTED